MMVVHQFLTTDTIETEMPTVHPAEMFRVNEETHQPSITVRPFVR